MNENVCRICFDDTKKNQLIKPCNCTNVVHNYCLQKWVEIKNDPEFCEICKSKYNIEFIIIPVEEMTLIELNRNRNINNYNNENYFTNINIFIFIVIIILILIILMILIYLSFVIIH